MATELVLSTDADAPVGPDAPLLDVMATMRAMRRLKPDPVPDDVLVKIVEAATWAPSGSNAQGYQFVVVTDRGQMAKLAGVWRKCVDDYLATVGTATPAATMGEEGAEKLKGALLYGATTSPRRPRSSSPATATGAARPATPRPC